MRVDETKLRQYLLKNLSEDETEKIDLQFFDDDELETLLARAEEDLIEDHIDELLSPAERELFDTKFLTSARRREQLAFFTQLKAGTPAGGAAETIKKPLSLSERLAKLFRPKFPQIVVFTSLILVFAVVGWWLIGAGGRNSDIAVLNSRDFTDLSPYKNSSNLNLASDVLRGNNSGKSLDKDFLTETILLRLDVREDAAVIPLLEIYRGENRIETLENVRVYKNSHGAEIRLLLPAAKLEKGTYRIEAIVETRKSTYNFKVQ